MNSWASDLSCTDSNYCWCCLLLTQVNRMSHEKTHGRRGTWSWGVPGREVCGRCVCDTEERGGQCLNVTTFLFAVNYGRGQGYWLCNSAEQTFSRSQWRWQKKRGSVFICVDFFFSLLPLKIKPVAVQQALNSCQRKGDRELKLKDVLNAKRQWLSEDRLFFMFLPYMYD